LISSLVIINRCLETLWGFSYSRHGPADAMTKRYPTGQSLTMCQGKPAVVAK
jgi:hypothetical protein